MRKPRDIDAELAALAKKARDLKSKKVTQLGELVIATGAETLSLETLAGALLAAKAAAPVQTEAWQTSGKAFFRGQPVRAQSQAGIGKTGPSEPPNGGGQGQD